MKPPARWVYGLEQADGVSCIVMELVEGPTWNSNGRELFYRSGDKIMAVAVNVVDGRPLPGTPETLFETTAGGYDVAPGGTRFLMLQPVPRDSRPSDLHVILNWFDELRRLAPLPD